MILSGKICLIILWGFVAPENLKMVSSSQTTSSENYKSKCLINSKQFKSQELFY